MTILTFRHIQSLHLMYVEVAWVLVSLGTQVQPHVILDPDYLFVSYETIIWIMIYEQYGLSDNNLQNIVNNSGFYHRQCYQDITNKETSKRAKKT